MASIEQQKPLPDKSVVITFDDAYLDILTHGKPILDKHKFPFAIFINPSIVERNSSHYLSWQQLTAVWRRRISNRYHKYSSFSGI